MNNYTSYKETYNALFNKETTCVKIVDNYLEIISERNSEINAFIEVFADQSKERANQIDKKITDGNAEKLVNVIFIKEISTFYFSSGVRKPITRFIIK